MMVRENRFLFLKRVAAFLIALVIVVGLTYLVIFLVTHKQRERNQNNKSARKKRIETPSHKLHI